MFYFSFWRREVEDKRPVDCAPVPRVCSPTKNVSCVLDAFPHHLFFCSIVFADFFLMNLILWVEGSSAAIPFGTLVAILALWFGISVPLTFIGAYFGFKKPVRIMGNTVSPLNTNSGRPVEITFYCRR